MTKGETAQLRIIRDTDIVIEKRSTTQILKQKHVNESWHGHADKGFSDIFYRITKRLLDIIVAGFGLILTSPLFLFIALLIKFDSRGPVLFRHRRIGMNRRRNTNGNGHLYERRNGSLKGKPIDIYKFRTMKHDVDRYAVSPRNEADSRITPVGRLIRSTCLDELPQLINVLKGDISIVGPRPEMPFVVDKYGPLESLRMAVKPGITGLWQLYGSRDQFIHENLQYDLDYIKNRSLKLDLKIMIKTIGFMLKSENV